MHRTCIWRPVALLCKNMQRKTETVCRSPRYIPAHLMYLLMPILYVCGELGTLDAKAHEKFWYVQVQVSRPGLALSSRFCPKMTDSMLSAFCGSGVPQCQPSSGEMLLFPILRTKGSLIEFFLWANWGFALFSNCYWKIPLTLWCTCSEREWRMPLHIVTNPPSTSPSRQQHCGAVELRRPRVHDGFSGFCRAFSPDC